MKFFHVLLFIVVSLVFVPTYAVAELHFELDLNGGLRSDQLDWNIAGNNVNVLSELSWDELEIRQLGLSGELTVTKADWAKLTSLLRIDISAGVIFDGTNRDSDYNGNDRTQEFSRSDNSADDGETFDAVLTAGLLFDIDNSDFRIGPLCGYSWHEQQLIMTDGVQTIPASGPFNGLDSRYDTEWRGLWAGVEGLWLPSPRWQFKVTAELHDVNYAAVADWNLRSDFNHPKSFEHTGEGFGLVLKVDGSVLLWRHVALTAGLSHGSWKIEDGRDRTFGYEDTTLNEVNWTSTALRLGLRGDF